MAEPNTDLLDQRINAALEEKLAERGGGGYDGGMLEARVAALEIDVKEVKLSLVAIKEKLAGIEGKLSNMPTTFQMLTWFVGVAIGLVGLVFAIARLV